MSAATALRTVPGSREVSPQKRLSKENLFPTAHSEIVRLRRCRCCGVGYKPSELAFALTQRMVRDTADHLRQRGVMLPWFTRAESLSHESTSGGAGSVATGAGALAVCRGCYDLYLAEKQLSALEAAFARAVGIPPAKKQEQIKAEEGKMPKGTVFSFCLCMRSSF